MAKKRKQFYLSVNVGIDTDGLTATQVNKAFQDIGRWINEVGQGHLTHIPFYISEDGTTIECSAASYVKLISRKVKVTKKN